MMNYNDIPFTLGDNGLINQQRAKTYITRILKSDRMGHAYLLTGPQGSGKIALALAFAELINGVNHLTNLGSYKFSKKSSWFTHPDIHLFLPMPSSYSMDDLRDRLELLSTNPYEIVDFNRRPELSDIESNKNKQAFYPIEYFKEEIRPKAFLKPNEGEKTVVILTEVELMRKEAANAFLKLLEEPSENIVFLLTTAHYDALLPTIQSRCQQIKLNTLSPDDIKTALNSYEDIPEQDAGYMARVSNGNYSLARFYDVDHIKKDRNEVISFLRNAYTQNAVELTDTINSWHKNRNIQGQDMLLNVLEMFLRDLMIYRSSQDDTFITNIDQIETIKKFCSNLKDAALDDMITEVNQCRPYIHQNVQAKMVFTTLAFRLSALMRNKEPLITKQESWRHMPAINL